MLLRIAFELIEKSIRFTTIVFFVIRTIIQPMKFRKTNNSMKNLLGNHILAPFFFIIFTFSFYPTIFACSGYKITLGPKTILGSNEDAWRVTPHIWFENGKNQAQYGAAFTGSRFDGVNGYAPQSGMNEKGLAFERLASHHPLQATLSKRKKIINPTAYLKDILHACATVDEVKAYISQYDHSYFIEDVFIYVEKSGKYLIVEPYSMMIGKKPSYVIANFCPSITSDQEANKLDRYRNGVAFLKKGIDSSLEFCKALSDTMHVCREKIGDGTLLSTIWDLSMGIVNVYFYHDFKHSVQFNLAEELKKGNHLISLNTLFPRNEEFEKLRHFKTPKNNILMGLIIVASGIFFLLGSFYFLFIFLRNKEKKRFGYIQLLLFPLNMIMFYYMLVLSGRVNVFYFPAPYNDPTSVFVSLSSYIPFLILILIIPFWMINYKLFAKNSHWSSLSKAIFTFNNLLYSVLIGLFVYWQFYNVFNG